MSPIRKRPQCQKCGALMIGHKRPNGVLTCPTDKAVDLPVDGHATLNSPLRREVVVSAFTAGYHYRNPNWEEPAAPAIPFIPRPSRHSGTPDSWVSTEPADDIPCHVKHEHNLSVVREVDEVQMLMRPPSVASSSASVASSSSTSSRLKRSFTSLLNNGVPLLSMFSAQREDVTKITQAARRNGLHAGVMRPPDAAAVKDEFDYASGVRQGNPLWVVVGRDPVAVEHIMELKENEALAKLDAAPISLTTPSPASSVAHTLAKEKPYQFSTAGFVGLLIFLAIFVHVMGILSLSML
ncbi:hypothetical protein BC835DRAFT_306018 [Cytidiella melzeri]|nr:hypothetical protein BC835DRAFT_306018 [Cytidiella melzeri]